MARNPWETMMARRAEGSRIEQAKPLIGYRAEISWSDGGRDVVDLGPHLRSYAVYKPVLSPRAFKKVRVDEDGYALSWGGDAEVAITTIERLVREQTHRMSGAVFKRWRMDKGLHH